MSFLKRVFQKKDEFAQVIERIVGFYPKQLSYYQQAFIHKSAISGSGSTSIDSYERLEFLGDAILDSVISHYLYNKFPLKDEGYLSQLRSRLVSRQNLNKLGAKIGLNELIKANLERESKSIYGDVLEALIGAIYLDKGYLFAQKFVEQKLLQVHIDIENVIQKETDFKSRVLEWGQKEKLSVTFVISEQEKNKDTLFIAELIVEDEVKGKGEAYTKKQAEQIAAEQFYKKTSE